MKCQKCGMILPEDSEFCQYCGARIELPVNQVTTDSVIPINRQQEVESEYTPKTIIVGIYQLLRQTGTEING